MRILATARERPVAFSFFGLRLLYLAARQQMDARGYMIKIMTLLLMVLLFASAAGAQQIPKSFSHLSRLDAGEIKGCIFIYYNARISKILMREIESSNHPGTALRAIETKIDNTAKDIYIIDYDTGPSADPHFIVYRQEDKALVQVGSFLGTELIVPGDGSLYVSGEADDFFNKRRKYSLKEGALKEVVQPYYYVGLRTTNRKSIDLYSDKTYRDKVAHLPVDSEIEVLLASKRDEYGYDYLVRSPYGLIGWIKVEGQDGMCGIESIEGICYHGD